MEILQLNQIESINSGRGELITNPTKGDQVMILHQGKYVKAKITNIVSGNQIRAVFEENNRTQVAYSREVYTESESQSKYCEKELDRLLKDFSSKVNLGRIKDVEVKENLTDILKTQDEKGDKKVHPKKLVIDQKIAQDLLSMAKKETETDDMFIARTLNSVNQPYHNNISCIVIGTSGEKGELVLFPNNLNGSTFTHFKSIKEIIDFTNASDKDAWVKKFKEGGIKFSSFDVTVGSYVYNFCVLVTDKTFLQQLNNFKKFEEDVKNAYKDEYRLFLQRYYSHVPDDLLSSCFENFNIYMAYLHSMQLMFKENLFGTYGNDTENQEYLNNISAKEIALIIIKTIACSLSVIDLESNHQLLDFDAYFSEAQKRADEKKHNEAQRKWNAARYKEVQQRLAMANGFTANGYFTGGTFAPLVSNKIYASGTLPFAKVGMGGYFHVDQTYLI